METAEHIPAGGVFATDLADILQHDGPFLSLYLETRGDIENAAARSEQHWRSTRRSLEERDLSAPVLDRIAELVPDAHEDGDALAVIAAGDEIVHVEHGPEAPGGDAVHVGPLPALAPILRWRLESPPHVVVVTDRMGADIYGFRYGRPDLHRETQGDDLHITRSSPGGWSQRRFQQRAENAWEENAGSVAEEVRRIAQAVDPRLIVVAGDVRAVNLLREALPEELAGSLQEVGGGRSADGSKEPIAEEAARLAEVAAAQDLGELLKAFEQERGQGDKAAEGVSKTLRALSMAQVEVLLVDHAPDDSRTAWFGPDPSHLAEHRQALEDLGAEPVLEARLVDACIRAALLTGARVAIVPGEAGVRDGVGALLRWST